ncbi:MULTISPECIES: cysteine--tRNA ligase [unclassified Sphingobium]|uniref:cysteine--tRNA ligase n=1 Tax=unclassified Sphingobium TaxID=2611147 RepID=UPI0022241E43|nr:MULTISPECIES: cysteine--tRNA ligase [unclassified Sphingobium]MCW2380698.1 cysteinyl-tRNA synthetase [Sphingobium sp. B2D3B]MCW2399194.1 cysteinyl-tRNA synthetase [Sphingobium sp. B2D3C]
MIQAPSLKLFNSLTRQLEPFDPVHPGEARVYSCGPTVYNYPHIGNMRAYVFADTLGRTLSFKGYKLTHVINITDVGHLTDDGDAGEDKMEKMAAQQAQSIWDIAKHYTQAYWADVDALNIRHPAHWSIATDFVPQMIEFAKSIADQHCYELPTGLYFDTSTVADYGRLAGHDVELLNELSRLTERLRTIPSNLQEPLHIKTYLSAEIEAFIGVVQRMKRNSPAKKLHSEVLAIFGTMPSPASDDFLNAFEKVIGEFKDFQQRVKNEGRIDPVEGKRHAADFAIWRRTPPGETRQMEWDSPWGKGAPGWHLECSVMSRALLGLPFDIHTGGIDHREIHHPNEIAQNQAIQGYDAAHGHLDCAAHSGARLWMHNNFLIDRTGKMSKSSGEFLRLQLLIDRGYHPLAYRMMCLQAHYRSELEFSWDNLGAALTRLKRMLMSAAPLRDVAAAGAVAHPKLTALLERFDAAISDDLNTPVALTVLDEALAIKKVPAEEKRALVEAMESVLGLGLFALEREALRLRPKTAAIDEGAIAALMDRRKAARAEKDFAASDALRDELLAAGVEVMDGDPLGWEWRLDHGA